MTSCVLVDLYRRFGVTYVSLVWKNVANHPRLIPRWWKYNLRNVVNHIFSRAHHRCIWCPSALLRCVLSNLWPAGGTLRIASEKGSFSCASNEGAWWSGGMLHKFFDNGRRWAVILTTRSHYFQGICFLVPLRRKQSGLQRRPGFFGEEKNVLPLLGIEPRVLGRPSYSLYPTGVGI